MGFNFNKCWCNCCKGHELRCRLDGTIKLPFSEGVQTDFDDVMREVAAHIVGATIGDESFVSRASQIPQMHEDATYQWRMAKALRLGVWPILTVHYLFSKSEQHSYK